MQKAQQAAPQFSQPRRQIFLMLLALGLFAAAAWLALPKVAPVFLANPVLNVVIGVVFVIGVLACFWQVIQLTSSVSWIEDFTARRPGYDSTRVPRLLAPLAALLRGHDRRLRIGATSARSILDSVATRIEEARDITRYLVSLLIFLGLLGTFYGLATTVPAVVETIRSLAPQDGEGGVEVFTRLMSGLEAQLGGMGTAFSSSLLGLAGSLVVGLLELFAAHGQNRFYRELEEWLSSITLLGFTEADTPDSALVAALAEQLAAQQEAYDRAEDALLLNNEWMSTLSECLDRLSRQMEAHGAADRAEDSEARLTLARVAEAQERLVTLTEARLATETQGYLRAIETRLAQMHMDIDKGRAEAVSGLRADLGALTRALRPKPDKWG
ncbi:hypothetical protein C8N32_103238 [Rhodovulum imhoffii]|uniref:MotA/TolQ/ExbB proton channel family protein n=1 Tax=Rhodovulum imhoffii TaxID=365340 RepID=A0A2T5BV39_9RHOB|nr:biopolymer transporter ExbB [Rhodovulum imhoffii]MBK5934632.1 biopolymer transporter ExbB [Rhodovulum imhoffii]PTN03394.1 hypothetical protein C8N32_103238 [Rhodovulum imhoffii]